MLACVDMGMDKMGGASDSIEKMVLKLVEVRPGIGDGACRFLATKDGDVVIGFCHSHLDLWSRYCAKTGISQDERFRLIGAGYISFANTVTDVVDIKVSDWNSSTLKLNTPLKYQPKIAEFIEKQNGPIKEMDDEMRLAFR